VRTHWYVGGLWIGQAKLDAIDGVQVNKIGNADTTGGLYLSRHVERTVMRNHQEQALKKRKQDEKSQQAQEKKRARHAALQSTADTVRQVLLSGIADWQKHLKAQDIKVAANLILHPRSFTSQKEAAPALQEWADAQRAALASRIPALGACSLAA
jgi:2-oxoglutarate dehydrogenase complex dehydrogenase (E1) component-like enzyme